MTYKSTDGTTRSIKASWLVGADGKKGVVRKHFLEKSGVRQVEATYRYEGTWIASNLVLDLPTPETHPEFPLWALGYSPEEVYDLFWPRGFHFCCPPEKPTASGRFGPHEERLWRHEFAQNDWSDSMDPEELLWEHIIPMITRAGDEKYQVFPCGQVTYPRDCIKVIRCRPFRFSHKVVNRWFENRTILVGDAAHIFPPFGGQGIACGVADSHQLAWRLFLLLRLPDVDQALSEKTLNTWALERARGVVDAANMTQFNGQLCNFGDSFGFWLFRNLVWLSRKIPFVPNIAHPFTLAERRGFGQVPNAFFLPGFNGGGRMAQIVVESGRHLPMLSDQLLKLSGTIITLVIIDDDAQSIANNVEFAKAALQKIAVHDAIISQDSIRVFSPAGPVRIADNTGSIDVFFPSTPERVPNLPVKATYDPSAYAGRMAPGTRYVLVRNDFYIFAQARDQGELRICLTELRRLTLGRV